jgi:AcrR family transcriptional regulator
MERGPKPRLVGRPHKGDDGEAKSRILEAAISVFAETGLAASPIKEISRRAGVTPALVYYHFHDRRRLTEETLERFMVPLLRSFWLAADLGLPPMDMLMELLGRVLRAAREVPWFLGLWSRELANEGGSLRTFMAPRLDRRLMGLFRESVLAGQRDGTINPDLAPELLYVSLISIACNSVLCRPGWERLWGTRVTDPALEAHVAGLLSRGLAGPKERSAHERAKPGVRRPGGPRRPARAWRRPDGRPGQWRRRPGRL